MKRPIDEVASEFVVLRASGKASLYGKTPESDRLTELYEEMLRRTGPDHSENHFKNAQEVYDLLNPNT